MSYEQYRPSRFPSIPQVIKSILLICVFFSLATFVLLVFFNINLNDILGLHYPGSEKFRIYQLVTYMFMHAQLTQGGFFHLFFNMYGVWMFGTVLENYWGPKRFLIYYMICGIGAGLVHYVFFYFEVHPTVAIINDYIANPDLHKFADLIQSGSLPIQSMEMSELRDEVVNKFNDVNNSGNTKILLNTTVEYIAQYKIDFLNEPSVVGASGSLFGILLAFGMLFPNTILNIILIPIPIKAKYIVTAYGLIELFNGVSNRPGDNVAHFAHLGGMLFGFIMIMLWKKNQNLFM